MKQNLIVTTVNLITVYFQYSPKTLSNLCVRKNTEVTVSSAMCSVSCTILERELRTKYAFALQVVFCYLHECQFTESNMLNYYS